MSRNTARAEVDFPQPDSPTSATVSPRSTENEMPSTAFTVPIWRRNTIPCVTGKCFVSPETSSRATASGLDDRGTGLGHAVLVVAGGGVRRSADQRRNLRRADLGGEGAAG